MTATLAPPDQNFAHGDIFAEVVVAFLAQIFLMTTGGNLQRAQLAALNMVNTYRTSDAMDLMAVAQIIACNVSALGSLGLAMAEGLSLSMILRLRGNAVALNRAIDCNRRALRQSVPPKEPQAQTEADTAFEARVIADVAAASQATAKAQATFRHPEPQAAHPVTELSDTPPVIDPAPKEQPPAPPRIQPARPNTAISESQWQSMWASAMTEVAGEFLTELPNLPPAERKLMTNRANALSTTASQLLTGEVPTRPIFAPIMPPRR